MDAREILQQIEEAEITWTVNDFKRGLFQDNLREGELIEAITENVYHNYSLVKDALNRTGKTVADLESAACKLRARWLSSYTGDDFEWAIWDAADGFVMEVLGRDSRICKRAGW
jgi:hypothetical protein